ncbi:MAG: SDR family oxidoreductase [Gammaproteobacteria bacterium]|nr:SDR family oxidoreductase [Gammaproteobacteria bacterium]
MELKDKVVVVTGGTAGVGYAAAEAFARAGARTAVISRDAERVRRTVAALQAVGGDVHGFALDVSDSAAVQRAAEEIETRLGPIEVWVNNAMTTVFGRFADMKPEEFERVTANTYLGTVWGTHAALTHMLPRNRGTIVQVGSALAHQSIPLQSAYCGAKHAVRGFTNAVRCELVRQKSAVRLTMVQLSAFNTPQFDWARSYLEYNPRPLAPVFAPEIAARAILRAATQPRREYWVGWPAMKTIIGSRLLPRLADAMAARQAFDGQMSDEPSPPRDGNLFTPVPRAPGAEGRFGAETRATSAQWWITSHRLAAAVAAAAGVLVLLWAVGTV